MKRKITSLTELQFKKQKVLRNNQEVFVDSQ
jgi:hypothetical protein